MIHILELNAGGEGGPCDRLASHLREVEYCLSLHSTKTGISFSLIDHCMLVRMSCHTLANWVWYCILSLCHSLPSNINGYRKTIIPTHLCYFGRSVSKCWTYILQNLLNFWTVQTINSKLYAKMEDEQQTFKNVLKSFWRSQKIHTKKKKKQGTNNYEEISKQK